MTATEESTEIRFGEDLDLLAKSASDVMRDRCTLEAVRASAATDTGYDEALLAQIAELGFLGAALPERYGGAGLPAAALVAMAEPMGRYLYSGPFVASTLAGQLLAYIDDPISQQTYLPQLARGELLASPALYEPDGSYDPLAIVTTASRDAAGLLLSGIKTGVLDAANVGLLLVSALCDGEPAVVAVQRTSLPDGSITRETLIDETRRSYRIVFDDTPAVRIGGDATQGLRFVHQLGALMMAADMSGGTIGSIDLTIDYLQTRTQFGRPIGSYQALKHPMVDIFVASEHGRSLLYHAATVFDGESRASECAVRMAKAHCGSTFTHAADRSIQFHGAIGFTYECHAQLFLRRAQWAEYQFGDTRHHRRNLQALLL
ncbi:MAG: acyl-CoA/acyl-ACP dehydrogenase [Myxococcales bacterium]|nr:acyl-CoA/acyl-ACP dehydrogenase [Myxococcales bacterium]